MTEAVWKLKIKIRSQLQQPSLVYFSGVIIFSIIKYPIVLPLYSDLIVLLLFSAI